MFNLRFCLFVSIFVLVACQTNCMAYGYYDEPYDYASDYIRRSQMQTDINLQHSMMQSQVNAMYERPQYIQVPVRQNDVDKIERPTYTIEKPLYKLNGD